MKLKKGYILIVGIAAIVLLSVAVLFMIIKGHDMEPMEPPESHVENMNMQMDYSEEDGNIIINDSTVFE